MAHHRREFRLHHVDPTTVPAYQRVTMQVGEVLVYIASEAIDADL
jgi:hypothetical protein